MRKRKSKFVKKLCGIVCQTGLVMLGLAFVPARPAYAQEPAEIQNMCGYIPDRFSEEVFPASKDTPALVTAGEPVEYESYYLTPDLPPVRNQGQYGTCWAFSSIACCEIDLIKNHGYDKNSIDLSELHTTYFSVFSVEDPLGGLSGDVRRCASSTTDFLKGGGNFELAINSLSDWMGAVSESVMPYAKTAQIVFNDFRRSSEFDSLAYQSEVHLNGYISVPMSSQDQVKAAIQQYGAVGISYYHDQNNLYLNKSTSGYYCGTGKTVNHAVTIVGWDDKYAKTNFKAGYQPSSDGAWIVRNSWGNDWGDNGYFYLSYEDKTISANAVALDAVPAVAEQYPYQYNYQYDGTSFRKFVTISGTNKQMPVANVFTAHGNETGDEELKAFSFEIDTTGETTYTAQIYTNVTGDTNPENGTLAKTMTGTVDKTGLYMVVLDTPVTLARGQKFSIVLRVTAGNGIFHFDRSGDDGCHVHTSSAQEGETFFYLNSRWNDITDTGNGGTGQNSLHLKAYTVDSGVTSYQPVSGISLDRTNLELSYHETQKLTATIRPSNATDQGVVWSSSNTEIAVVDSEGNVTAKSSGTAVITARAHGNQSYSATCMVNCRVPVESISIKGTTSLYLGTTSTLSASITPSFATDKTVRWSSSDTTVISVSPNEGSSVTVKANKAGTATITASAGGKSASCEMTASVKLISDIILNRSSFSLILGENTQLTASIAPSDATYKTLQWSSSDNSVATVDKDGKVTAMKPGTAVITATATDGSRRTASCTVTVKERKVSVLTLDKTLLTMTVGDAVKLNAAVLPENATNRAVRWSSGNQTVAVVDENGNVTAKAAGTVVIKATAADESGKEASCVVTVKSKPQPDPDPQPTEEPPAEDGWHEGSGVSYWYENGEKQGVKLGADGKPDPNYRGKEIYDPSTDAWYWLDNEQYGAVAKSKDVYQESLAGDWGDMVNENGEKIGKWVRYDENGHMVKGWNEKDGAMYYFDIIYGTMAKGEAVIDGITYQFDPVFGFRTSCSISSDNQWHAVDGVEYWYENGIRQGYNAADENYRGKEIYDPDTDAWYWLDNIQQGAVAKSKDVYQESLAGDWGDQTNEAGEKIGKWVRYDANGHMIKGWCAGRDADAVTINSPAQADGRDVYYFDLIFGTMAKGRAVIDGNVYYFDPMTGILQ